MNTPPSTEPAIPHDPQFQVLVGWFLIVVAVPLAIWIALRIHDKFDARSWPKASAEVVKSELYERRGKSHDWCIKMAYRYEVDGQQFVSSRSATSIMSESACDPSRAVIQARFEKRQPGDRITIRHHPREPGRAIAHVDGLDIFDFLFPAVALGVFATGVHSIRYGARLRVEQAALAAERRERMARAEREFFMKNSP
ncbi:DUF3592 domain-containing protein [Massilia oculi]|uniref:DUF3592 domain-containing protein n=1 Tax=Massilia oculi TaxID=945844 RepID=A0A2S2DN53_9BURK|nr:DUF3592 domain-containing protein [Massilia oculi]AWL06820.1 hypothetical protein DIR46_21855 [Massilia oculi]